MTPCYVPPGPRAENGRQASPQRARSSSLPPRDVWETLTAQAQEEGGTGLSSVKKSRGSQQALGVRHQSPCTAHTGTPALCTQPRGAGPWLWHSPSDHVQIGVAPEPCHEGRAQTGGCAEVGRDGSDAGGGQASGSLPGGGGTGAHCEVTDP